MLLKNFTTGLMLVVAFAGVTLAQHEHAGDERAKIAPPTVFLDKSAKAVEYQLKRLSNEQLLRIETATDHKKYIPVFSAILSREGMSASNRSDALAGLVAINDSNVVAELVAAMLNIKGNDDASQRMVSSLGILLLKTPLTQLDEQRAELEKLVGAENSLVVPSGMAALLASGNTSVAFEAAEAKQSLELLYNGISLIPDPEVRSSLHAQAMDAASAGPVSVRRAAIAALATMPANQTETFLRVADYLREETLQTAATKTLLSIASEHRNATRSAELVGWLVDFAEATPASERTTESFLDAMELVDQLMAKVPTEQAKAYRERLRETVVRVVRIRTVEEEMRYNLPYFAVETGRPVQVVLLNQDMMPHNLVFTQPGALKEIAELGLQAGPNGGMDGKQYVPRNEKVLWATQMVNAHEQEALTFTAPTTPGEYPYVCTFPRHWMRMYGVMVVVDDLDAWLKNPVEPKDPVGSNRSFVKNWTVQDFEANIETGLRGRTPEIGKRLFVEASCAQCHRAGDLVAGNVGPELAKVMERWKGNSAEVLREILDPSHRIEPKYVVHIIVTEDGETLSGLVVDENNDAISILDNPEAKEPKVLERDEIIGIRKTENSMMPKGLLDRFSQDEIFEILAYLQSVQQ
jgi:putative heme-binding domain-containing protein